MIINTVGLVLSTLRYSDSSVIAKIYTEQAGLRSFMIRTGNGKNAMVKMAMLQPLSIIELSFDPDLRKGLQTPRSLERSTVLNGIPFDTIKTCIALFMAEVVGRSIAEEESNPSMFRFLKDSVIMLDGETNQVINFHLKFMIEFSRYLGFYPHHRILGQNYFDMTDGEFAVAEPQHPYGLEEKLSDHFENLMNVPMMLHHSLKIGNESRRELLQKLIDYYRLHLDGMKEITSHKVLEEVLD